MAVSSEIEKLRIFQFFCPFVLLFLYTVVEQWRTT